MAGTDIFNILWNDDMEDWDGYIVENPNMSRYIKMIDNTDNFNALSKLISVTNKGKKKKKKKYVPPVTIAKEPTDKQRFKNEQKAIHKKKQKWVIGGHYIQKIKPKDGSKTLVWEYELIKFVYTINDYPMNSLIVKRVSGPDEQIYTVGHNDCKRLHIKYQPGLQIMSMDTPNLKLKTK